MKLAAIYIGSHEYLFVKPETLNFGGRYYYSFREDGEDSVVVTYKKNKNYVSDFFVTTPTKSKINSVTAIVGQNGAGKSTILDIIRSAFATNEYAYPWCKSIFLMEDENGIPIVLKNDFRQLKLFNFNGKINLPKPIKGLTKKVQSIYYSPHFDYKYNPDFDNVDNHDISFDKILELDLKELSEKETNENGWSYTPTQELLYKNSLRQIEFMSSDLVIRQKIFSDIFQLPSHNEPLLIIRGYKKRDDPEWNTPTAFRGVLEEIKNKIDRELKSWHKIRKFDEKQNVLNQLEINQYIIKRNILTAVLSLLYKQMEKRNQFLSEGDDLGIDELRTLSAYESLILFIEKASILGVPIFETNSLKDLINKLYEEIEKVNNEDSVSNTKLKIGQKSAIQILQQQRRFISELNQYYDKFYKKEKDHTIHEGDRIDGFISYMPFSKRLSSGEHALLNLFSRLYNFIELNLNNNKFRKSNDHYILLIDEGDLSFHPNWKKKYVKALLNTLPYFFDGLENNPSLEIIFTTHDPLALSDIPNSNVIYVERKNYNNKSNILDYDDKNKPNKTFGANISNLLADSFFTENSLIGDFVFDKIRETIKWLENEQDKNTPEYYKKVISLIDEPIVQRKLAEMYDLKMGGNFHLNIIEEQISILEKIKKQIKK
jgi:hypothetical protein